MKKLLISSVLLAGMLSFFSCSDNNEPYDDFPDQTTTEAETTAEPTTEPEKKYDYVHGSDGYFNILDDMPEYRREAQKGGSCWAYSAAACLETSYFLKNGKNIDIDPIEIVDTVWSDDKEDGFIKKEQIQNVDMGGWEWMVTETLSRSFGDITLDSASILTGMGKEAIKEALRTRGGVSVSTLDFESKKGWYGPYYTMNDTTNENIDHAITIIGYDDHFPKEYFNEEASQDGAWITYNSADGMIGSYYYVSYDTPLVDVISFTATDKYGEILSYDVGNEQDRYIKTGNGTIVANVFHKQGKLAAVGTYNDFDEQNIKIEIYDSEFKNRLYSQDAVLDFHGYHTIELDKPIDVTDYAIVVSYEKGAPVEGETIDFGNSEYKTVSEKGQSFVYIANWKDMTDSDIKTALGIDFTPNNCCIKALYAK